jgi:putative hydrolase of the HAD superfamily
MKTAKPAALFFDVGGVLLTNGWDRPARERAARAFDLPFEEMEERHRLNFDTYELGKLALEDYLSRTVFYRKRSFKPAQFRRFMFAQSKPYPPMIGLARDLKAKYGLKIVVVSNEGRELNSERIRRFGLNGFVDFFITSCYVRLRKPDADIFRLALDACQMPIERIVYIENTAMFVRVAESLGIRSILHKDYESTRVELASFGLQAARRRA